MSSSHTMIGFKKCVGFVYKSMNWYHHSFLWWKNQNFWINNNQLPFFEKSKQPFCTNILIYLVKDAFVCDMSLICKLEKEMQSAYITINNKHDNTFC